MVRKLLSDHDNTIEAMMGVSLSKEAEEELSKYIETMKTSQSIPDEQSLQAGKELIKIFVSYYKL